MATTPIANILRMAKDIQMWLVDKLTSGHEIPSWGV
jgi:hypothetical protein